MTQATAAPGEAGPRRAAQARARPPMLPPGLFANTTLSAAVATRFTLFATIFGCVS